MFNVKQISYEETKPFILGIHYARRMPCVQYAFGIFDGEKLVGVVTYGQPASAALCKGVAGEENRSNVLELNRLCLLPEYNGQNYGSMLVGRSLKMLPKGKIIVSYADAEGWNHVGYVYQATNWMYTGKTKSRTDKYSECGHARHYLQGEKRRQYRTAKHRYIFITGDKRQKKKLKAQIRYPCIDEYPKGKSDHYDPENPIAKVGKEIAENA